MAHVCKSALSLIASALIVCAIPMAGHADVDTPYPGTKVIKSSLGYKEMVDRLKGAIKKNKMGLVAQASATVGAKSIGVDIPGNAVLMVYRPDFAVRMLNASVPAGIEAPIRFYVTEGADGKATLTYRKPSSVFAPYKNADLDKMALELDDIFAQIEKDTLQ